MNPPAKWTIVNGEWVQVPAILIDPNHPYAVGADKKGRASR